MLPQRVKATVSTTLDALVKMAELKVPRIIRNDRWYEIGEEVREGLFAWWWCWRRRNARI